MKGDFSRWDVEKNENFNGVLHQQGRVLTDNDWNAGTRMLNAWQEQAGQDTIGPGVAAVPAEEPGGFKVIEARVESGQVKLDVSPGRVWAEGLLTYLPGDEADPAAVVTRAAIYLKSPFQNPPAGIETITKGIRDAVILEVWQEAVNGFQMPEQLIEPALGGPDTTERVQTAMAFKLLRLKQGDNCENIRDRLKDDPSQKGRLKVTLMPTTRTGETCPVVEGGGYTGFEHYLYRVEIAQIDDSKKDKGPYFKWSRFNGGLVGRGVFKTGKLEIKSNYQAITSSGHSSFYLEAIAYDPQPPELVGVGYRRVVYGGQVTLTGDNQLDLPDTPLFGEIPSVGEPVFFRLWDGIRPVSQFPPSTSSAEPKELESGIRLEFDNSAGHNYKPGDYWTFTVRAQLDRENTLIDNEPPHGITYHRVPLAILNWKVRNGQTNASKEEDIKDCRIIFPGLTHLKAGDILFENRYCRMPATGKVTVQDALDFLCRRPKWCTLVAIPGKGWEKIFDEIKDNQSAQVCLQVGTYYLDSPVYLKNKGNIKMTGCGKGTKIIVKYSESAFIFENCQEVIVRDLYMESSVVGAKAKRKHLNGTITFKECDEVNVERISVKNGSGSRKAAACITVRNSASTVKANKIKGTVNIQNSSFTVGHHQVGILLVNADTVHIENNTVSVGKKPKNMTFDTLVEDNYYRGLVRRSMISGIFVDTSPPGGIESKEQIIVSGYKVYFKTEKNLAGKWSDVAASIPGEKIRTAGDVKVELLKVVDQIIKTKGEFGNLTDFKYWYKDLSTQNPAVAAKGIAVGGEIVRDLRILNNRIRGVFQGIHLGLSHREQQRGTPDIAGKTIISGNTIAVSLPPLTSKERFGIFIGNCKSAVIENNYLEAVFRMVQKWEKPYVEGIRVYGHLGKRMIIRQNHLEKFSLGIYIKPLNAASISKPVWVVEDNVASVYAAVVKGKVKLSHNYG